MKTANRLILIVLYLCTILSCKDVKESDKIHKTKIIQNDSTSQTGINIYFLRNKERVNEIYKDSIYTGVIEYTSLLDTITTELFENEKYPQRGIFFYKTQNNKSEISLDEELYGKGSFYKLLDTLKKRNKLDTFYAVSSDKIPIFNLKFNQLGTNYINGIIQDLVYLELSDSSKVRLISNDFIISNSFEVKEPDIKERN